MLDALEICNRNKEESKIIAIIILFENGIFLYVFDLYYIRFDFYVLAFTY